MPRHTAQDEQVREHIDDIIRIQPPGHTDRQSLAGEFIHNVEHADFAPVMRTILDEVVTLRSLSNAALRRRNLGLLRPDVVGPFWPQPDA